MTKRIKQKSQSKWRLVLLAGCVFVVMGWHTDAWAFFSVRMVGDTYLKKARSSSELDKLNIEATAGADVVVANLEGVITDQNAEGPVSKRFFMKMQPLAAADLSRMGIKFVTLANNHSLDYGLGGLIETVTRLNHAGIRYAGSGESLNEAIKPLRVSSPNGAICIFAFSNVFPDEHWATSERGGIAPGKPSLVTSAIKNTKNCWSKVASFHWGREKEKNIQPYQRELAAVAIKAGASAVVGHHPHVIQRAEWILGAPVIYSLGNFVFDTKPQSGKPQGVAADLVFAPNGTIHKIRIMPWDVDNQKTNFKTTPKSRHSIELWDLYMNLKALNCDTKRLPWNCVARE